MEFLRVYSMGKGGEGVVERGNIKKYVSLFFYYTGRNTRNHEGLDDDVVTFILIVFTPSKLPPPHVGHDLGHGVQIGLQKVTPCCVGKYLPKMGNDSQSA